MNAEPEKTNVPGAKEAPSAPEKGKKAKKEKPKKTLRQEIMSWVWTLLAAVVIAGVVRALIFEPIRVDGESMRNTLHDGDIVFVTKPEYIAGNYQRGDVIICRYPNRNASADISIGGSFEISFTRHTLFVKRLIALPGDTLQIEGGVVSVNGQVVDESGIDTYIPSRANYGPITLGADQFFVMGDNRGNSNDSRMVGPISKDMIVGHVRFVLLPFKDFGKVE